MPATFLFVFKRAVAMDKAQEVTQIGIEIALAIFRVYAKHGVKIHEHFGGGCDLRGRTRDCLLFDGEIPSSLYTPCGKLSLDSPSFTNNQLEVEINEEISTFLTWQRVIPYVNYGASSQYSRYLITSFNGKTLPYLSQEMLNCRVSDQKLELGRFEWAPNMKLFFLSDRREEINDNLYSLFWQVVEKMMTENKIGKELTAAYRGQTFNWYQPGKSIGYNKLQDLYYQYFKHH